MDHIINSFIPRCHDSIMWFVWLNLILDGQSFGTNSIQPKRSYIIQEPCHGYPELHITNFVTCLRIQMNGLESLLNYYSFVGQKMKSNEHLLDYSSVWISRYNASVSPSPTSTRLSTGRLKITNWGRAGRSRRTLLFFCFWTSQCPLRWTFTFWRLVFSIMKKRTEWWMMHTLLLRNC